MNPARPENPAAAQKACLAHLLRADRQEDVVLATYRLSTGVDRRTALIRTVHLPRLGAGQARGQWSVIEGLIREFVSARGIPVTVYDLPGALAPPVALSQPMRQKAPIAARQTADRA